MIMLTIPGDSNMTTRVWQMTKERWNMKTKDSQKGFGSLYELYGINR